MNAWWPKGSPHEARRLDEYADWEIRACIDFAAARIAAEPDGSLERARLQKWAATFEAERADRARVRAEFAARQKAAAGTARGSR